MSQQTSNFVTADNSSDIGRMKFIIATALSGIRTAIPVQIMSVTNNGGVSPIGTVSVKVLVQAKDGNGNAIPHGTIYNCPYMRVQGGTNAIILDPQVGDIGLGIVCDRDISAVQNARSEAPPGSSRKNNLSDMVYLTTIISATTPVQYIQFNDSGITINTQNKIILNGNEVDINAQNLVINANVQSTGTFTNNGTNISSTHVHGGVQPGGSNTLAPH